MMDEIRTVTVNMKRMTPREIKIVEEHTGFTAHKWQSEECPVGQLSEALAFIALRRQDPTMDTKQLWELAADTVVEPEDEDPPNGSSDDS